MTTREELQADVSAAGSRRRCRLDRAGRGCGRAGPSGTSPPAAGPTRQQVLAYDLAHAAAQVATARAMLDYGAKGDVEARITCAFVADMVHDLITRRRRPRGDCGA